tara:strand:- start:374 stop:1063 length:690 start_codon:yes stop_codon:yes gene_type:complete
MIAKRKEKEQAITLRKQGRTYDEILEIVHVSRSTLSLWLRDVGLSKPQKQNITKRRKEAQLRGAQARYRMRIEQTKEIFSECEKEVGNVSDRDLFMIGVALYWAEGAKEKEYRPSERACFANSDADMVRIYMKWIRTFTDVSDDDIELIIHIHDNHKHRLDELRTYWLGVTNLSPENLATPVYKKHKPKTNRKKVGETYKGLVAIRVKRSTILNRRIQGWVRGIIHSQN